MQFVTSRINTTPVSVGDALEKNKGTNRSLDEILHDLKGQKQVKTAQSYSSAPVGEVEQASGMAMAEQEGEVEDAACAACGNEVETGCSAGGPGEIEIASVEPMSDDSGLFDDPMADPMNPEEEDMNPPLFSSKKPMILKVAKKADFRPWNPEEIVKAWNNYGDQKKCVASTKGLTSDPKAYCFLLQTASEEATTLLKTAAKAKPQTKTAAPKGVFKKLASLPDKDRKNLYDYWKTLYGDEYANAMMEDYVK